MFHNSNILRTKKVFKRLWSKHQYKK